MLVPPGVVSLIDWAVLALTGLIAAASLVGALYSVPWTRRARRQAPTRAFNYLWVTRFTLQFTGALYALALDLRLQPPAGAAPGDGGSGGASGALNALAARSPSRLAPEPFNSPQLPGGLVLWSYRSPIIPGGYQVDPMCRLYIGLTFGFLEPAFLLLVLFSCMYTVHKHSEDVGPNPNLFIFALTVGLTLPMCAAQVFAALFSRIITQLRYHEDLMKEFFAASIDVSDVMCPPDDRANPNCAVCVWPAFSTLISAAFGIVYLLSLWAITGAIASAAINKMLSRRIRALQLTVTLCFCIGVALRGVTVRFYPYSIGFVALTVADVIVTCVLLVSVSFILGWVPVGETRAAGRNVALFLQQQGMSDLDGPTELLPLVDYPAGFGLFDRQDSLSLEGGHWPRATEVLVLAVQ
ncbi:hypothetical protein MNEG_2279 [Monoraphidium neglectum]|uniref:Uncharacterized protein n=1 Tax=Monoraphidium neglectum TaxID=145388 RepID=A0A0D2NM15_9CHLO|nr:hypothetical protein MNEG_2279 [Monoraphidium neglectum]KIZ05681.1 hypothetical protein MNEG_2279 [Monoraphidium neglectum]|eukprot:XP_013904700.1 hypothetical protein MNEG_2279 [Monoraphidium neglectum]